MPSDAFNTPPKFSKVKVFGLPWHTEANRQLVGLTQGQRFKTLRND